MPFDGPLSERLPTFEEAKSAREATHTLAKTTEPNGVMRLMLSVHDEQKVLELPRAISDLVLELLMFIAKRESVTLVPFGAELTTQQAADLLNVSRPYLVKLLGKQIPFHKVGTHRRIRAEDLLAYKRQRDEERSAGMDEILRLGQEFEAG
jgi:excisionase family DNA binding protein